MVYSLSQEFKDSAKKISICSDAGREVSCCQARQPKARIPSFQLQISLQLV